MNLQTVAKKAALGNKYAMQTLHNNSKNKVWFLCKILTRDENKAKKAYLKIFEKVWITIQNKKNISLNEFNNLLVEETVKNCKRLLTQSEKSDEESTAAEKSDAFCNTDTITSPDSLSDEQKELVVKSVEALSDNHRFCIVLNSALGYSSKMAAQTMNITDDKAANSLKYGREALKKNLRSSFGNLSKRDLIFLMTASEKILKEKLNSSAPSQELEKSENVVIDKLGTKKGFNKKLVIPIIIAALLIIAGGIVFGIASCSSSQSTGGTAVTGKHHAVIDIKNYGKIKVELDADSAPISVNNFIDLAKSKFYDGLTFHRVIKDFMMQGGDPKADGTGGSKKTIKGEFSANGVNNSLKNVRGAIAMARSQSYDSGSSQFYIVQKDHSDLDGQYAVFGNVTDGMDIVDKICNNTPVTDSNGTVEKANQPVINSITITD